MNNSAPLDAWFLLRVSLTAYCALLTYNFISAVLGLCLLRRLYVGLLRRLYRVYICTYTYARTLNHSFLSLSLSLSDACRFLHTVLTVRTLTSINYPIRTFVISHTHSHFICLSFTFWVVNPTTTLNQLYKLSPGRPNYVHVHIFFCPSSC